MKALARTVLSVLATPLAVAFWVLHDVIAIAIRDGWEKGRYVPPREAGPWIGRRACTDADLTELIRTGYDQLQRRPGDKPRSPIVTDDDGELDLADVAFRTSPGEAKELLWRMRQP
jgi:hypothetical protein